ncbi:MAG: methyltransferase domain-containing protein [Methylococcales symbiont of Iophon sp. n. MRB-2018]|nr:MAG: methyltransferase domain-containing protein [Methylococcales symbiont of Iophon sp. n. MRB-2018]KAF3980299.1 MAG: methyltransferase domain-containing protein [Methylococcales symbiont of Iophon sp. n. MRB-2018]
MSALSQVLKHIQDPSQPLQAQRLFHGRGHAYTGLHHLTIDWLPPVILIALYAAEPITEIEKLADHLLSLFPTCKSIQLQHRYILSAPIDVIKGDALQQFSIQEYNLHFYIRLGQARNTGLFLDMRNGRRWIQQQSNNKRVVNLFAYTCGFSVAAIAGNAKSVLNVDISRASLSLGRENHRLNQQSLSKVRFEKLNIFKSFSRLKKRGRFDLLICDPPTFQKGSVDIVRDYPKIIRHLDDFMAENSTLLLCLNAPEINADFLIEHIKNLAPRFTFIEEIKPPEVFLETQGKGLKALCFKHKISLSSP